mmetsp:Transcript_21291/g.43666  ORF Transcript_21291/g.43666 Transcript_21291/m.43666 type:complete len:615 (-) Transcript_21291:635-2479(-)
MHRYDKWSRPADVERKHEESNADDNANAVAARIAGTIPHLKSLGHKNNFGTVQEMTSLLLLALALTQVLSNAPTVAGASTNATANLTTVTTSSEDANITQATNITNSNALLSNSTANINTTSNASIPVVSNITTLSNALPPGAANGIATNAPTAYPNVTTSTRSWINVLMPLEGDAATIQSDPFRTTMGVEADPFRFTEMPSSEPSALPSSEPSARPTPSPTPRPTIWKENSVPRNADQSYFDYNPNKSSEYGPGQATEIKVNKEQTKIVYKNNNWKSVKKSAEEEYWMPLQKDIKFNLKDNACSNSRQSPIDIWPAEDVECEEHHQIRHRPGDFRIDGSDHIKKQILPSKLRLVFHRREGEEPDPPYADFPNGFGEFVDALHADIKIPSEHRVRGKQFVAEYQLYHLHLGRDRAPVISVMIDLHPEGEPNRHLQRALDEWQKVFDADEQECQEERRRAARRLGGASGTNPGNNTSDQIHRNTQATTERKIWDPYHPDIMPSIHFYGYSGSLTEPPCTEFIEWRVIDKPMLISPGQLLQMQTILFNHVDNKCRLTSNHYEGSVARPIQDANRRPVYQCTCRDFLADDDDRRVCTRREFRLQNEAEAEKEAGQGE